MKTVYTQNNWSIIISRLISKLQQNFSTYNFLILIEYEDNKFGVYYIFIVKNIIDFYIELKTV